MSAPVKAELAVLDKGGKATETIPVQFNPTTMKIQMTNSVDGGASKGRQTQQYNGSASTTLTLDLEFDTADEGVAANPVDVRTKTDRVRQFVLPGGKASKQAPPRVRFRWGTFELSGVMDSLVEELTFFSSEGVPLRSKLSVSIKEQDARFSALERGSGANTDTNPPAAGEPRTGSGPGSSGGGPLDRAAEALAGETPADFLARNGLEPDAWRALGDALDVLGEGIELDAGLAIGFSAEVSISAGLGVSAGFQAGIDVSVDASLGLTPPVVAASGADGGLAQGFALAAAGGLTAAANQATATASATAADAARTSFGETPRGGGPSGSAPASRAPIGTTPPAAPRPAPSPVDRRAATFGLGVPLRDRVAVSGTIAPGPLGPRAAPWERVSPGQPRRGAGEDRHRRQPSCGCHRCDPLRARGRS